MPVLRVYQKQSTTIEELKCIGCGEAFADGERRQVTVNVCQNDEQTATFAIEQIHSDGCLQERDVETKRMELRQVRLPRRSLRYSTPDDHESLHEMLNRKHAALLKCCRNYTAGLFLFWPGWSETDAEMPSYHLIVRSAQPFQIDKTFYTYSQFKAQFSRVYHLDVSVVEIDGGVDLSINDWFKKWHRQVRKMVKGKEFEHNLCVWSHLVGLPENNKAELRFVLHLSIHDAAIQSLYQQTHSDLEFSWNDILNHKLELRDRNNSWDVALYRWQQVLNAEFIKFTDLFSQQDSADTVSATITKNQCHLLSYTQPKHYNSEQVLSVQMNYQMRNEDGLYYMFDSSLDLLFAFKGELEDGLPLVVANVARLTQEMEMAQLTRVDLHCLKQQFRLTQGKLHQQQTPRASVTNDRSVNRTLLKLANPL